MIVTRLKGGLGNQLFQYATTRNAAIKHECEFYFDTSYFEKTKNGYLCLDKFDNAQLKFWKGKCGLPKFTDDFNFKEIPDHVYLTGWWQSEKYFKDIRDTLLEELDFSRQIKKYIIKKYPEIRENSVTMHIRRGDYVLKTDQYVMQTFDYYKSAYEYLNDKNIKIFILSNDIPWCKENLKFDNICYVEENNDIIDLCIMSMCNHNIISNSTFSWWGAWLNNNLYQTVIAPLKWFGPAMQINDSDIVPENWTKI
jgi:hypothetical protein